MELTRAFWNYNYEYYYYAAWEIQVQFIQTKNLFCKWSPIQYKILMTARYS